MGPLSLLHSSFSAGYETGKKRETCCSDSIVCVAKFMSLCPCSLKRKVGKGRDGHMLAEINVTHRARTTHAQSDLKYDSDPETGTYRRVAIIIVQT